MKLIPIPALAGIFAAFIASHAPSFAAEPKSFSNPSKTKIVLIGDSTMTDRAGWGLGFQQFLTDQAECINASQGGRSSQSFMNEGRWTNALKLKADYYLVQFGHNNEPGKPGRSTDMPTFVANMKQYVEDARKIGAKPVLVTPLTRRQWDKQNPGKIKSSLEPYAQEVRKLAASEHVPLVDLHARSVELCESLGPEKCLMFSPTKLGTNGVAAYDGTHLQGIGRVMFARLVVEELRKATPELSPVLRSEPRNANPQVSEDRYDTVVSHDISANYTNLQAAIDGAPDDSPRPYKILVKPGMYEGQFLVPKTKRNIHLIGEDITNTVLTYGLNVNESDSHTLMSFRGTGVIVQGNDFSAENITFQNTSGDHGQALALRVDGDRAVFNHCRMLGWQDTLMINSGRLYFTNCHLAGRVDFIYGSATAVFDHCEILSKNGGHITAASTAADRPFGFVFLDCHLTGDPHPWTDAQGVAANTNSLPLADLGRPWRPYASVAYIRCEMDGHIKPDGWNNWRNVTNETTARYSEYKSTGPGANPEKRFPWTKQLSDDAAKEYTVEKILGGTDNWKPGAN